MTLSAYLPTMYNKIIADKGCQHLFQCSTKLLEIKLELPFNKKDH